MFPTCAQKGISDVATAKTAKEQQRAAFNFVPDRRVAEQVQDISWSTASLEIRGEISSRELLEEPVRCGSEATPARFMQIRGLMGRAPAMGGTAVLAGAPILAGTPLGWEFQPVRQPAEHGTLGR